MSAASAVTGPFVATAAARGSRAPLRLLGHGTRGWALLERHGDWLCVDEFGDLWWTRPAGQGDVDVVRAVWPEECTAALDRIRAALEVLAEQR